MTIYVGNISFRMSEADLKETFGQYGEVTSVKIVTDRETGRSKGFGFIDMESDSEGQAAIDALDGAEVGGRNLRVNKAIPRERA
jgi:cold-inducible RNA-binding protein